MRSSRFRIMLLLVGICLLSCTGWTKNLTEDPSFESPFKAWFLEEAEKKSYLGKLKPDDAFDGLFVLEMRGWETNGSIILSPVLNLNLDSSIYSATANIRVTGTNPVVVEVILFDESGAQPLISFGRMEVKPETGWQTLSSSNKQITSAQKVGRLGLRVEGNHRDTKIHFDAIGLFNTPELHDVKDNAKTVGWEAWKLNNGNAWKAHPGNRGNNTTYYDYSIGDQILSNQGQESEEDDEIFAKATIGDPGQYKAWVRFLHLPQEGDPKFTIELRQNGRQLATKQIQVNNEEYGAPGTWAWDSIEAPIADGDVEIVINSPSTLPVFIDYLLLTNQITHKPAYSDFRSRGYVRFTNQSEGLDPFCLWINIRNFFGPEIFRNAGVLSHAGLSGSYTVPSDSSKWLASGDTSPWVRIDDMLYPNLDFNFLMITATRGTNVLKLVTGNIKGELEFAWGDDFKIVKTVKIDQSRPRVLMTVTDDFETKSNGILTAFDYIAKEQAVLPLPKYESMPNSDDIEVSSFLSFQWELDDPRVIDAESDMLKRLGMNNYYNSLHIPPGLKGDFHRRAGFLTRRGLSAYAYIFMEGDTTIPDVEKIERLAKEQADEEGADLSQIWRINITDEPTAIHYDKFILLPSVIEDFRKYLKELQLSPEKVGMDSWEKIRPVAFEERAAYPELYYYGSVFRLKRYAEFARTVANIYSKYFPEALSYANISPPTGGQLIAGEGNDPFYLYRGDGFGMMWTEDWPNYGASPQHMSSYLALLESAGRPGKKPIGGYCIPLTSSAVRRINVYQWLQVQSEAICFYSYGPFYSGIDSWGRLYEIYPDIAALGREAQISASAISNANPEARTLAILYNRTADIWQEGALNTQQDANYIHWALAHAGYNADFIPEEDIDHGSLSSYKVLYINGIQMKRQTAEMVAEWVSQGGVLFGTAGAASRDEFNAPMDVLDPVFGVASKNLSSLNDSGTPMFQTPSLPILESIKSTPKYPYPQVTMSVLAIQEQLEGAKSDESILVDSRGNAAGVKHAFEKGVAIRTNFLPGINYFYDAMTAPGLKRDTYLPQNYRNDIKNFICWPACLAKVEPTAEKNAPLVTIRRWDTHDKAILYLIDYSGAPCTPVKMVVPRSSDFGKASSLRGTPVSTRKLNDGRIEVELALNIADTIILEKTDATSP